MVGSGHTSCLRFVNLSIPNKSSTSTSPSMNTLRSPPSHSSLFLLLILLEDRLII